MVLWFNDFAHTVYLTVGERQRFPFFLKTGEIFDKILNGFV